MATRYSSVKEEYFPTHLRTYEDHFLGRKLVKNKKQGEKVVYSKDAKVFTYDTPSHVPKRTNWDHFLAEFSIYRKKIKS